jgi:hypothetical protein
VRRPDFPSYVRAVGSHGNGEVLVSGAARADDVRVDTVLGTLVGGLLILGVTALAVIAYQRSLDRPGGREGLGTMSDAFGGLIDVFHPAHAEAREEMRRLEHQGSVTPTPGAGDDPLRLEFHPDGTPRAVRIRGPHCRY